MKSIILLILIFISTLTYTQTIPLAMRFDSIPETTLKLTDRDSLKVGKLTVKIRDYDVFQTESGQFFIEYQDPRLVYRRKYLGYMFGIHEYEDNTIFFNADTTKAWIWMPDRYGTPTMKMPLPDYFADWARIKKD